MLETKLTTMTRLPLILFFLFSFTISFAQDKSNFEHTIQSEAFGKERKVRVFLPERYHRDSTSTYIVTYVLDAQSDEFWGMAKNNIGYLVNGYSVIPMIAVGIVSDDRGEEFSPPATSLQDHLRNEVFPLIEKNYRVKPFRTVVGHSWGGAFIGTTLFGKNRDLFDAYIGISPSFGDTDNVIVKHADTLLKAQTNFKKYLYLSHGDVGRREAEFGGYVASIDSLMTKYPNQSLAWQPRLITGTDHWQIVIPSFNDGLISMSRNYFADQKVMEDFAKQPNGDLIKQVDDFYEEKLRTFGFINKPTASYLNFVGNDFRDLNDYKTALVLYKMALTEEPDNVKVYVNLADTYDKMENKELAKKNFIKTLELLETNKEALSENYYRNVSKWAQEKLAEYK